MPHRSKQQQQGAVGDLAMTVATAGNMIHSQLSWQIQLVCILLTCRSQLLILARNLRGHRPSEKYQRAEHGISRACKSQIPWFPGLPPALSRRRRSQLRKWFACRRHSPPKRHRRRGMTRHVAISGQNPNIGGPTMNHH